jgi:hypothetical protein
VSTTGEMPAHEATEGGDQNADVLAGATAELAMVALRACARAGALTLAGVARAGEGILLVPGLGPAVRDLDRRWRADREALQSRGRSVFEDLSSRVVEAVLASIDLTSIVVKNVDIDRIVEHVDVDAAVARADVVGMARYVIEELDLPEMIRESSGTLAADTIEGLRMQGMNADNSLSRFIDRLLGRRDGDSRGGGGEPSPAVGSSSPHMGEPHRADA